ncbi:MAG TPA: LLM class flavin-dependent oxidoreductase [Candidatus Binataceae bacterium]|nr:LLM class flavin-dependent oxidoreductase [Candidatus Binataceae bacterium]
MSEILTCTWAPTALSAPRLTETQRSSPNALIPDLHGPALVEKLLAPVVRAEALGIDYLLVAQRWWGTGEEIEGSTYDCIAMTAFYAAHTKRIRLITAIHPGFFLPATIAKWGTTLDRLTAGRWAINVTTGWHEQEFGMFGAALLEHDERYARSREFIEVLRGAWSGNEFSYAGRYYDVRGLKLDPPPCSREIEVWQGGQSAAALSMAATYSDWMFLNGGPPEKIRGIISRARELAGAAGRTLRFALYAIPLCRETDSEAQETAEAMIDSIVPAVIERRRERVGGAQGMWAESDDRLTMLDSNEGYASRLIGSAKTILERIAEFHALGVDCFHLALHDRLFNAEVLPQLKRM